VGAPGAGGEAGAPGPSGPAGDAGAPGCAGLAAGESPGLIPTVSVSTSANGQYFTAGEQPVATIRFTDKCGQTRKVADLGTANLYLSGPRRGSQTRTAAKLLNCVVDRAAADHQHHFINLKAPTLADPSQHNLTEAADGAITYTLGPISTEAAGTYTLGVWAKSKDDRDQVFPLVELQIGSAAREEYASGPNAQSSCYACHLGKMSGKSYQAHSFPGFSPLGNWALDQAPIANCQLCHNLDGYSPNPTVRKVHGAHRGAHLAAAGVAHPEYGLSADATLSAFTDVEFPSMPGAELDCAKCHVDDRWKTSPARLACGTCHDNVFFDTGTLTPPRSFGRPAQGSCTADPDCAAFGVFASCDVPSGTCQRKTHPIQTGDAQCPVCHTADASGLSPISARHEIFQATRSRGLRLTNAALSGASGPNGTFLIGDVPTLTFKLTDMNGAVVTDLKTNAALSGTVIVGGPTDDRQRLYGAGGSLSMKTTGTLTFDGTDTYRYVFPAGLPAQALAPLNTTAPFTRPNVPGTYTVWAYVNEALTVSGQSFRDAANAVVDFKLGADQPILARQVIAKDACNSCHVKVQAHGGSRQEPTGCSLCHTKGAVDRTLGAKGIACTQSAQCPGNAAGWETCQDTNGDTVLDTCVVTADPTPSQPIDFSILIHDIHYARVRDGYAERNNLVNPGALSVLGFSNTLNDFSDVLFPQDIRNCTACHADAGGVCSAAAPCGVGQTCQGGTCVNTAWLSPSKRVCTSCHDEDAVFGHAALQTWLDPSGNPVETCDTCHGPDAAFAVDKVHAISDPYVPPYPREKQ
jgi:hypothetical protein